MDYSDFHVGHGIFAKYRYYVAPVIMLALLCTVTLICSITATPSTAPGPNLIGDSPQARTLFFTADKDHDHFLTRAEFHLAFLEFDINNDTRITLTEFLQEWSLKGFGTLEQSVHLFNNLDVNRDSLLTEPGDMPLVFYYFDRNSDDHVTEGEFVIQWVKIST